MELFPIPLRYQAKGSSSTIVFYPEAQGRRFIWQDKSGTYRVLQREAVYFLELSFNYAREETFQLTILHTANNIITHFILSDRQGRDTEFHKIEFNS
jgi:hypothetical protein